jgi:hypothetical protein
MSLDYGSKSSVSLGRPSALFADLGAEVIEVEPPRGDLRTSPTPGAACPCSVRSE